jgi:hypothetical protein
MKTMHQMHAPPERPFSIWQTMGTSPITIQVNPYTAVFVDPVAVTEFFQRASSAQQWTFQAQLAQLLTSTRVEVEQGGRRISKTQKVINNCLEVLSNPYVQGSLQILNGAAEITAGYGMTWATGFALAPIGHVVAVHGIDQLTTGLYCVTTGKHKVTATELALTTAGVPSEIASLANSVLSMTGIGVGTKVVYRAVVYPQHKLPPPCPYERYDPTLFEEYKVILRMQMEKPHVVNPRLREHLEDYYRPNACVGSGSTAAAIRMELASGEMVRGKFHSKKGRDTVRFLEKWLKSNPDAGFGDRAAAENIIKDIKDALQTGE